jgi:hypothetical protein
MLRDASNQSGQGKVDFSSLPPQQTISAVLGFLENYLPRFSEIYLSDPPPQSHLEDIITSHLNRFLQSASINLLFDIGLKKGVDLLIWIKPYQPTALPLLVIEAKRLPPQNNKDYVKGRTGGIERFKREQEGFDQPLAVGAMVGYVQKKTFDHWYQTINRWIDELIDESQRVSDEIVWSQNDRLLQTSSHSTHLARYTSKHARKTLSEITLYHFWVQMSL